jgi:hypothetical protein
MDLGLVLKPGMTESHSLHEIMRAALAERGQTLPQMEDSADPLAEALVRPSGADQYVIDMPRGIERNGDLEVKARQWFHEAGLPQGLVRGIVQEYCRCLSATPQKMDDEQGTLAELARDWGQDCARKVKLARSVIARCGDATEIEGVLSASGLGNNAWLIRSLAALAELPRPDNTERQDNIQGIQS